MEVYLADRVVEIDDNSLRKAQASWRGAVVRQKMKSLHQAFRDIYDDIEDAVDKDPWSSGLLKNIWSDKSILWKRYQHLKPSNHSDCASSQSHETNSTADTSSHNSNHVEEQNTKYESEKQSSEHSEQLSSGEKTINNDSVSLNQSDDCPQSVPDPSRTINETSVWDSIDVTRQERGSSMDVQQERQQVIMELVWVQQAINSRKQYLRLKKDIT